MSTSPHSFLIKNIDTIFDFLNQNFKILAELRQLVLVLNGHIAYAVIFYDNTFSKGQVLKKVCDS